MPCAALTALLKEIDEKHRDKKDHFYRQTTTRRAALLDAVEQVRDRRLGELLTRRTSSLKISAPIYELSKLVSDYARRSDWALFDVVALGSCLAQPSERIANRLTPAIIAYQALRMLDDVIDEHYNYKGRYPTLLGSIHGLIGGRVGEMASNLIPILLMIIDVSSELAEEERIFMQRTLAGMLDEAISGDIANLTRYREMTEGKMVSYGMLLYSPILGLCDPDRCSFLGRFLRHSFYIAQVANDLQDREEDGKRNQINFWNMNLDDKAGIHSYMLEVMRLSASVAWIEPRFKGYAHARIADLTGYSLQIIGELVT